MATTNRSAATGQAAGFVEPMQCLPVAKLPEAPDWEYEIKFDGYRALGIKRAGQQCLPVAKLPEGPDWEYEIIDL